MPMNKTRNFWILRGTAVLLLLFPLVAPSTAGKAKSVVGDHADFARYKTYQWVPVKVLTKTGVVEDDPAVSPAIRTAVNRELAAKGLTEVQEGGDLQVAAFAATSSVPQLEAVLFPGSLDMMYATPIATMGRYNKEGTLAINLIDSRTKTSAYAALVTDSLDNKPGSGVRKIPAAAKKLFSKYPATK